MPGGVAQNNYSVIGRIMLRFRPIAPKPSAGDHSSPPPPDLDANNIGRRRTKRKYVRVRARQRKRINNRKSAPPPGKSAESSPEKKLVTLQLLPVRSEVDMVKEVDKSEENNLKLARLTASKDGGDCKLAAESGGGLLAPVDVRSVIETCIIVECVTDAYIDGRLGLGFSDWDKMGNLKVDSCPGFVSDSTNKVVWINEAYRKMAAEGDATAEKGIMVWLVVKENLPHFCPSFACRVRLIQSTREGQKWNRIVPCDVWRMGFSGFAWKLDVDTALGLRI